jgi:preprotein translocase subunit YajC
MNTSYFTYFLAQQPAGGSILGSPLVMMLLMIVMFYFLIIRPQQKQKKELAARIASLEVGDKIVTIAGVHATVHSIKETTLFVRISEGQMEIDKASVSLVQKKNN